MATKVLEPVHEFIINMQRRGATLSDFVIQIRRMYEGLDQRASTNRALRQQMINELMLYFKSDDIRISPSVSIHDLLRAGPSHKDAHQTTYRAHRVGSYCGPQSPRSLCKDSGK